MIIRMPFLISNHSVATAEQDFQSQTPSGPSFHMNGPTMPSIYSIKLTLTAAEQGGPADGFAAADL